MKFNFDGITVELTTKQMREVYHAYMREMILEAIDPERGGELDSEYEDQYTREDIEAVTREIYLWMEDNTLGGAGDYDYITEGIYDYDRKFRGEDE